MAIQHDANEQSRESIKKDPLLKRCLDGFGNIFALNICFIIGCLPIFTIGASLTAMYAMSIRLQEDEEETVSAGFIHEFKRSFKQATTAFLIIVAYLFFMFMQFIYVNNNTGPMATFYTGFLFLECVLFALSVVFLFPLIARFENNLFDTWKNSIILAISYLGSWFKIGLAWVAPVLICLIYPEIFLYAWYLWLLIGFGAIAYGTSISIRNIFNKNMVKVEEAEKKAQEEKEEEQKEFSKKMFVDDSNEDMDEDDNSSENK